MEQGYVDIQDPKKWGAYQKWRRTFYSSRSKSDNGHIADNDYFKHHKIFDEETYWDVVPSINMGCYNFLNMENIKMIGVMIILMK